MSNHDSTPSQQREGGADREAGADRDGGVSSDQKPPRLKISPGVLRFAGLGTELAVSTLAIAGIGYFVDSVRGHEKPYATAFGTLIGFTLGMVRFIHQVRKAND